MSPSKTTRCYMCPRVWKPEHWKHWFTFCVYCRLKMLDNFEDQMRQKQLTYRTLRVEEK